MRTPNSPSRSPKEPTLPQLRAFAAVAATGHFGAAAERLGVSQPTVSQALAGLERSLDCVLVERTSRGVLLTDAGRRLLPHAQQAVEAATAAMTATRSTEGPLGPRVDLGIIPTVAPYLLPLVLDTLAKDFPDTDVSVREDLTDRLLADLDQGGISAAIVALPVAQSGRCIHPLYDEDFVVLLPRGHPWSGRRDVRAQELGGQALLLLDEGHCLRDQALDICRANGGTNPAAISRSTSLPTVVRLVAAGFGITLLPDTAVATETGGRLPVDVARFAEPAPGRHLALVHRASSPRMRQFGDFAEILHRRLRDSDIPVRQCHDGGPPGPPGGGMEDT